MTQEVYLYFCIFFILLYQGFSCRLQTISIVMLSLKIFPPTDYLWEEIELVVFEFVHNFSRVVFRILSFPDLAG